MRVFPALLALALAACASLDVGFGVQPGVTSAEEVVRLKGPPAVEIANPDGSKNMAYPRGYFSGQTFMVHVGRDGLVQNVEQVLTDDRFYRIVPGITRGCAAPHRAADRDDGVSAAAAGGLGIPISRFVGLRRVPVGDDRQAGHRRGAHHAPDRPRQRQPLALKARATSDRGAGSGTDRRGAHPPRDVRARSRESGSGRMRESRHRPRRPRPPR